MSHLHSFSVADHLFGIDAPEAIIAQLPNYAPFATDKSEESHVFIIHVDGDEPLSAEGWTHLYTDSSDDDMPRIEMYQKANEWLFRVSYAKESEVVTTMRCSSDWRHVYVSMFPEYVRFAMDNAAMLVYAFSTAGMKTLLFHSSVTVLGDKGFMFLGHSGTGKSTHSEQWKKAFPQAQLLNDDNPVVRLLPDETVRVYGSPWSGKTPCYKNDSAPVQALVQLAQAPYNQIKTLRITKAYPYILASVSGLKILPAMMDRLFDSIAALLERVPVYRLECLPNEEAARLCAQTCLS